MQLSKYFLLLNTVRHLKPIQVYWRYYLGLKKKCSDLKLHNHIQLINLEFIDVIKRPVSYSNNTFQFLNQSCSIPEKICWNDPSQAKLWLYNLHYFDYLLQRDLNGDTGLKLMTEWISDNPPCEGNGWEPYPLSLRIVNWIKFLQQISLSADKEKTTSESLFLQCRSLRNQLEFHLLGNHLFKNAVALLFAGRAFTGAEANDWYKKGRTILIKQLDEQVLDDGGHFERSPMYHALILEDILDCINLIRGEEIFHDQELESLLVSKATLMLGFLSDILHPDGSLPLFNDSAQGISSSAEDIFLYASSLGLEWKKSSEVLIKKPDFGLYLFKNNRWNCIIDAGMIGPDYLPGHAHCDTLSYELALDGKLIVVNAGVFQYAGAERNVYRATRSHNTVEIDNAEQHEIWSTFRVARRGYPQNIKTEIADDSMIFAGQHTGYQRLNGRPLHQRDLNVTENCINVVDWVIGKGEHSARSFIHLHPEVKIISKSDNQLQLKRNNSIFTIDVAGGIDWVVDDYNYSPEFGLKQPAKVVVIMANGKDEFSFSYIFGVVGADFIREN